MTSDLYPSLLIAIEKHDRSTDHIYYVDSVAIHDGRVRIWFLGQANAEHNLELTLADYRRFDISLNTGDPN